MQETKVVYFDKPGKDNTEKTLELALAAAREQGIRNVIVASSRGGTADMLPDVPEIQFTVVYTTPTYRGKDWMIQPEQQERLRARGITVFTAAHALSGVERAFSTEFKGVYPTEIMANTLRMFGQGTKVCVEIAAMAVDGGYIESGERVLCVAGTGGGADTAMILCAAPSHQILKTKIEQYVCKPEL